MNAERRRGREEEDVAELWVVDRVRRGADSVRPGCLVWDGFYCARPPQRVEPHAHERAAVGAGAVRQAVEVVGVCCEGSRRACKLRSFILSSAWVPAESDDLPAGSASTSSCPQAARSRCPEAPRQGSGDGDAAAVVIDRVKTLSTRTAPMSAWWPSAPRPWLRCAPGVLCPELRDEEWQRRGEQRETRGSPAEEPEEGIAV